MKKETIEETAEIFYSEQSKAYEDATEPMFDNSRYLVAGFIDGAKWQAKTMYSKEAVEEMFATLKRNSIDNIATIYNIDLFIESWTREFKKQNNERLTRKNPIMVEI